MDVPLPWERLLWSSRPALLARCRRRDLRGVRHALTDVRLVLTRGDRVVGELALQDIGDVQRIESRADRLLGASNLVVFPRDARRPPLRLDGVRRGAQLAALLELLAGEAHAAIDARDVRAALDWEPRVGIHPRAWAIAAVLLAAIISSVLSLPGTTATPLATYPLNDAIYPGGRKQSREAIVRFMETTVMPWARDALGPLKGGPDRISCATCHGPNADARGWQMPAVAALPAPVVADGGWEHYGGRMDPQIRNAIYGYLAESDKQTRAAYMREIVVPGMASLLHRPAYDFTKPYAFNRSRAALGCYHCHQVK